jgi:hypothetical protein
MLGDQVLGQLKIKVTELPVWRVGEVLSVHGARGLDWLVFGMWKNSREQEKVFFAPFCPFLCFFFAPFCVSCGIFAHIRAHLCTFSACFATRGPKRAKTHEEQKKRQALKPPLKGVSRL